MDHLFWFFHVQNAFGIITAVQFPLLVGFLFYQLDYAFLLMRYLVLGIRGGRVPQRMAEGSAPAALLIMPTLLRTKDELDGMKRAILSTVTNGYPGSLVVVASIDDGGGQPVIYRELERWIAGLSTPAGVRVFATCTATRTGKAVAIAHAVDVIAAKVASGALPAFPPVVFNMDGDSELGPHALERMVLRLTTPAPFSGQRPMIVTSNVCIAPGVYWRGWRDYLSVRGQIAILVAREYVTSISIGKFNTRLIPVQEASGALYCTWSALLAQAPKWAAFMQTLTLGGWVRWWFGAAPASFAASRVAPLPEAQTGPGDDTWVTWFAGCARWNGESITLELPRTPFHAFLQMIHGYVFRPVTYEPSARIVTKTPTTVGALFRQRVRWNSSRIQDFQRWAPGLAYHWRAGVGVIVTTSLVLCVHGMITASLLLAPLTSGHGPGVTLFVLALMANVVIRAFSTVFALAIDGSVRRTWRVLLGLPLAVPYHLVFNILPTIVGSFQDIFLFGVNTKFSPEQTYIKSGLSRIALGYRIRRAFALAIRSAISGDVPFGAFWFGWHATKWTPNGFEGWTTGRKRVLVSTSDRLATSATLPAIVDPPSNVVSMAEARKTLRPRGLSVAPARRSLAPASTSAVSGTHATATAAVETDLQRSA